MAIDFFKEIIFAMVWLSAIVGTCLSFRKMKSQSYLETTC